MFWIENSWTKIWKIEKLDKYDRLQISTSEKDSREEGVYRNSNWLASAVGHAHNQIANGEIVEGDRVKIVKGKVTNESYTDKNGDKKSSCRVVILEFEPSEEKASAPAEEKKSAKKTTSKKKNEEISDDELPF